MINKLQLNNLIISNKKEIRRGCVQAINKLVHKIRTIKSKLAENPDDQKKNERLRRSVRQLECLKKLRCADVIKQVLLLEKSPTAVISNALSTSEEIAIATLAVNKVISNLIQSFKQQLNLDDTNCTWRKELSTYLEFSNRRAKFQKTKEQRRKLKGMKSGKAIAHKRLNWLKNNNPNLSDNSEEISGSIGGEILEGTHTAPLQPVPLGKVIGSLKSSQETGVNKHQQEKISKALQKSPDFKAPKKRKDLENTDSRKYSSKKSLKDNIGRSDETISTRVLDPFFITDSGEPYLSTAVALRGQQSNSATVENTTKVTTIPEEKISKKALYPSAKKCDRNITNMKKGDHVKEKQVATGDQTLHPSWAAKQKLKPVIAPFEGKKILFDDDVVDNTPIEQK